MKQNILQNVRFKKSWLLTKILIKKTKQRWDEENYEQNIFETKVPDCYVNKETE